MSALPTTRTPCQIDATSWSPSFVSRAHGLQTQRRSRGGQRWKFSVTYPVLTRAEYLELWAFLNALRGQVTAFTLTLPTGILPQGTWGGTPLAAGASSAGASSIPIDGLPAGITGAGKAGDFVKFSGHSKVYQVKADFNSNGSGQATMTIMPALVAAVADNEAVTYSSVPVNCILTSDDSQVSLQPNQDGMIGFSAIEDYS